VDKITPIPPLISGHKINLYQGIKKFFGFYAMALFSRLYGKLKFTNLIELFILKINGLQTLGGNSV
jgi:hypothetical protein